MKEMTQIGAVTVEQYEALMKLLDRADEILAAVKKPEEKPKKKTSESK